MNREKSKRNPISFMFQKLWEFSEGNRKNLIIYIGLFTIAQAFMFLEPLIVAKILNIVQEQGIVKESLHALLWWLCSFLAIEVAFWVFHGPARILETANAFIAKVNYRKYLLDGTMDLPASWHADHHSGDTIDKIEKASEGLRQFGVHTFEIVQFIVKFITSYIALIYFNPSSSYIILGMIIITLIIIIRFDRIIIKRIKKLNKMYNGIAAKIFDTLSNITTIIILRIQRLVSGSIFRKMIEPYYYDVRTNKYTETKWFFVSLCVAIMNILVMGVFFIQAAHRNTIILVGTVSALFAYTNKIGSLFYHFAYRYGDIVKWRANVANAEIVSDMFTDKKKVKRTKLSKWKTITIQDLDFQYENSKGKEMHLKKINITIHRKERIAFIGESGSGKTTMLKIMRELYTPKNVKVFIDKKFVSQGLSKISNSISLIPQDPEIFTTTIKDNISVGISTSSKRLKKYTDLARFTDVIKRLPHQWNSSIVEKGVNLSGGEKQRLALSRGLFASQGKEIILLDEPTSSVDAKNELAIYKNIFSSFKQKTIISSIHRLHLLSLFDTIYFFSKGRIIASGSYDELKKNSLTFRKLLEKYQRATKKNKVTKSN